VLSGLAGKKIMLGVLDLSDPEIESPSRVAERIQRALPYVRTEDLIIAPDCGLKYLPREIAFGKLRAMVDGAQMVRTQLQSASASSSQDSITR
jgi:5-methyltetrahydropteroyltriglutamate--homocysteine methyltransferase